MLEFLGYILARVIAGVITALILSVIIEKQRTAGVVVATC
jgi:uncharacterized membrane protein YraQ (UPF0718 family)